MEYGWPIWERHAWVGEGEGTECQSLSAQSGPAVPGLLCAQGGCFPWIGAPRAVFKLELQFQGDKCRSRHPGLLSQRWPVPGCLFRTLERLQVSVFFP